MKYQINIKRLFLAIIGVTLLGVYMSIIFNKLKVFKYMEEVH
jgi:hypothetical protein